MTKEKYSISERLRLLCSQIFAVGIIVLLLFSKNGWQETIPFLNTILFVIGVVFASIGSLGRLWCSLYIAGYKTDKLIQLGPYSMCRNPLYFFSFIGALGLALASETLLIPVLLAIGFALYYPSVIKSEENKLQEIFGEELLDYKQKVPRFFPKLSLLNEPQDYLVKPILFKEHMFDAIWFIWFLGVVEIIKDLHTSGILPSYFTLY